MTFEHFLLAQDKSNSTIKEYEWSVAQFKAWLKENNTLLDEVNSKTIVSYLAHLQRKGLLPSTRYLRLIALHHFFDYDIDRGTRIVHPSRHLKLKGIAQNKLYAVLSPEQLDKIYNEYKVPSKEDENSKYNWFWLSMLGKSRNKVILGLMIYQGLTTAEIAKLELSDIALREGTVFVRGSRKTKERTIELKSWQVLDLMEYQLQTRAEILKHHTNTTTDLFLSLPSGMNTKVKGNNLKIWEFIKDDIRKQHPFFHNFQQLRASVIVHWLGLYNLRQVQTMVGHINVATTEKYLAYKIEDLKEDIDKFHPMG